MTPAPTAEQIAALKAKHGEELYQIDTHEGPMVLRPPTRTEFDAFINAHRHPASAQSACHNLAIECVVYPDSAAVAAAIDELPATSKLICDELEDIAGGDDDTVARAAPLSLDVLTADEKATLAAAGCDLDALRAKHPKKRALVAMRTPLGLFIVRRPARTAWDEYRATSPADGAGASYHLALACVVYPTVEEAARRFTVLAALHYVFLPRLRAMAGEDQVLRAKKI